MAEETIGEVFARWHKEMVDWIEVPDEINPGWIVDRAARRAHRCQHFGLLLFKTRFPPGSKDYMKMKQEVFKAQKQWGHTFARLGVKTDFVPWQDWMEVDLGGVEELTVDKYYEREMEELKIYVADLVEVKARWLDEGSSLRLHYSQLLSEGEESIGNYSSWAKVINKLLYVCEREAGIFLMSWKDR
jgi:hypothetical protein